MRSVDEVGAIVRNLGGVAQRQHILDADFSAGELQRAARQGVILRVRRAWFAVPDAAEDTVRAVMMGARLGAFSAAATYGMWRGDDIDLHVSWPSHGNIAAPGARFLTPGSSTAPHIVRHWRSNRFVTDSQSWRESPQMSIMQIFLHGDATTAIASCDSALSQGWLDEGQVHEVFGALPERLHPLHALVDGSSQSGLETMVRLWVCARGERVRSQVQIGAHRVDLVVGSSLIIETDGLQWHSDDARFNADRIRTAELQSLGYTVVRLSYRMIMQLWDSVVSTLESLLLQKRHLDVVSAG